MRNPFSIYLVESILDVGSGSGSGEVASLAFPNSLAFLLDKDTHEDSVNRLHKRIMGGFLQIDLKTLRVNTILLCHSVYYFAPNIEIVSDRMVDSGAKMVLVLDFAFISSDFRI